MTPEDEQRATGTADGMRRKIEWALEPAKQLGIIGFTTRTFMSRLLDEQLDHIRQLMSVLVTDAELSKIEVTVDRMSNGYADIYAHVTL